MRRPSRAHVIEAAFVLGVIAVAVILGIVFGWWWILGGVNTPD